MKTVSRKLNVLLFITLIFHQVVADEKTVFECQKVSENVYCLYGEGGNIGILNSDEGLLIVDSQFKSVADSVLKIIKTISRQDIKYLINTHYHADHTGGNEIIGKNAEIIMHPNCKSTKQHLYKQAGMKDISLNNAREWKEGMVIHLGEETVRLLYFGPAHTSGDLIVVFEKSKVIHAGDLFFNGWPPYIDVEDGADTENWIRIIEMLCEKYQDYKFIPGHGEVTDGKRFLDLAKYLKILRAEVAKAIKEGKSREETIGSIKINGYSHLRDPRSNDGLSVKKNIGWVYDEMTK
jgi:cyclase